MRASTPGSMLLLALVLVVFSGCTEVPPVPELPADYAAQVEQYRVDRMERLKTGWLTLSGLHWLEEGRNAFGSDPSNSIVFPADTSPELAGVFVYASGKVTLETEAGAGLTLDGEIAGAGPIDLEPDARELGLGRLTFFLIERGGRFAIRVKDPEHPAVQQFGGIDFYPVDESWVKIGALTPPDAPRTIPVETVIGTDAEMESRGRIEFRIGDEVHSLEAFAGSDDTEVFIIFMDGTTGEETYPAGRYLYAGVEGDRATLDFNKAYNPPCAFTPYATCPLPPPGNRLSVRIQAGEKTYHPDKSK